MKTNKHDYPWKTPRTLFWCFCSFILSLYLCVYIPTPTKNLSSTTGTITLNVKQEYHSVSLTDTTEKAEKDTQQLQEQNLAKKIDQNKQTKTYQNIERNHRINEEETSTKYKILFSNFNKIIIKIQYFAKLFLFVGIGAFLGAIIELRNWHLIFAKLMGKLTNVAHLPKTVGLAMPTALFSNVAANTILMNSYRRGNIQKYALIVGGMTNSYLSYVSHSLRVMYPVVATIGLPGILYFIIQFTVGLFFILCTLLWHRWYIKNKPQLNTELKKMDFTEKKGVSSWSNTIKIALLKTLSLFFRMFYITVPLMLGIEYLLKSELFSHFENLISEDMSVYFKGEMLSIIIAQMGGLIQSSAISVNLRNEGIINNTQILLAMLIGSVIGSPVRMFRRNLPASLAIFPVKVACIIVFSMQCASLALTITAIYVIIFIISA